MSSEPAPLRTAARRVGASLERAYGSETQDALAEAREEITKRADTCRRLHLDRTQVRAAEDAITRERDEALRARDSAQVAMDEVHAIRDAAIAERDRALQERDRALQERDAARKERAAAASAPPPTPAAELTAQTVQERAAEAIWRAEYAGAPPDPWESLPEQDRSLRRALAKAALDAAQEALREG